MKIRQWSWTRLSDATKHAIGEQRTYCWHEKNGNFWWIVKRKGDKHLIMNFQSSTQEELEKEKVSHWY